LKSETAQIKRATKTKSKQTLEAGLLEASWRRFQERRS